MTTETVNPSEDEALRKEHETKSPEEIGAALRTGAVVHAGPEDEPEDEKPEDEPEAPSEEGGA